MTRRRLYTVRFYEQQVNTCSLYRAESSILLFGLGRKKAIYIQPVHKGIKPAITGSIGIPQAKTMTPILVKVKLNRYACFVPGINDAKLTFEKKIISGNDVEHGRSVFGYFYRAHPAIDRADKR